MTRKQNQANKSSNTTNMISEGLVIGESLKIQNIRIYSVKRAHGPFRLGFFRWTEASLDFMPSSSKGHTETEFLWTSCPRHQKAIQKQNFSGLRALVLRRPYRIRASLDFMPLSSEGHTGTELLWTLCPRPQKAIQKQSFSGLYALVLRRPSRSRVRALKFLSPPLPLLILLLVSWYVITWSENKKNWRNAVSKHGD